MRATRLLVKCHRCGVEAPAPVIAQFSRQLRMTAPGTLIEAAEGAQSPRLWLMRTGGGAFGEAKCACPDHRTAMLA